MTTEELVLGHYDGLLTSAQEKSLHELLARSPEARSLFEQHGALQRMLVSDAGALAPSSRLDDTVIARALATAPEAISSGATGWFGGKVAAAIAVVVAGGVSVAVLNSGSNSNSPMPAPVPTVRAPQGVAPAPVPAADLTKPDPSSAPAAVAAPARKASAERTLDSRSDASISKPRPTVVKGRHAASKPRLSIDSNATELQHAPKVESDGR